MFWNNTSYATLHCVSPRHQCWRSHRQNGLSAHPVSNSGYANVETFIASGNVIFESRTKNSKSLEQQIEQHLRQALNYEVSTFIRSVPELASIARHDAFPPAALAVPDCRFMSHSSTRLPPPRQHKNCSLYVTPLDDFHLHARVKSTGIAAPASASLPCSRAADLKRP